MTEDSSFPAPSARGISSSETSLPPNRIPLLKRALEVEWRHIEEARQTLRLNMAAVEAELGELTSQQAELQKLQVAIDQVLGHWNKAEVTPGPHAASP